MLIRRVTAHAFGPLVGATLELAEAMTVVYGPNESAKSSWHAAIFASLCGRRRVAPNPEERRFAELHKPWDRTDWLVSAEVLLDDGRLVEVRHDLAARIDCHVKDLELARDYSAEFTSEGGTPDLTRWLGLDRHSFAATACIAQTQVLSVLLAADGLQQFLQRATASPGAHRTAAAALDCIDVYRRDHVGTERAPTKPLRQAMEALRRSRGELDAARLRHREYEGRLVEVDRLRRAAWDADHEVRRHEAAAAARTARHLRAQADEVADIDGRLGRSEPRSALADEAIAQTVGAALAAWWARPALLADDSPGVGGQTDQAEASAGVTEEQLRDLARELERPMPSGDLSGAGRVVIAQERLTVVARSRVRARWSMLGGLVAALAGACLLVVGRPGLGAVLITCGAVLLVASGLVGRRLAGDVTAARSELELAQVDEATQRRAVQAAQAQRAAVVARCADLGVAPNPEQLRERARVRSRSAAFSDRDEHWRREWERTQRASAQRVRDAARAANVVAPTVEEAVDLLTRWQVDRKACVGALEEDRQDWARMGARLGDGTLDDLLRRAAAAEARAARSSADLLTADLDSVPDLDDDGLRDLRAAARSAAEVVRAAEVCLQERAAGAKPVAEAEEELARAELELDRIKRLDATLSLTRRFLLAAQETAHRSIAPVLVEGVKRWLPAVTLGRYTDVFVSPETLRVQVRGRGGPLRDADRLSFGTAEQVYLLLRIALAGALVRDKTTCPLLLDDVTVHADGRRVTQILELLLRASAGHQIIVFTQQEQVRDWARASLHGPRHAVRELATIDAV